MTKESGLLNLIQKSPFMDSKLPLSGEIFPIAEATKKFEESHRESATASPILDSSTEEEEEEDNSEEDITDKVNRLSYLKKRQ